MRLDFVSDLAAHCKQTLVEWGCRGIPEDQDRLIFVYCEMKLRRVSSRPRTVSLSDAFSVPPHLEDQVAVLFSKVANGDDVWRHQSRNILNANAHDGMLYDFGVQHFHLGVQSDPRHPVLIQGTSELMFAIVEPNNFFAIGIFDHENWSNSQVLDVAHRNWPHLFEPFRLPGPIEKEQSNRLSSGDLAAIRGHGANAFYTSIDGNDLFFPIGGGQSTAFSSIHARMEADRLIHEAQCLEVSVRNKVLQLQLQDGLPPAKEIQLVFWHGSVCAIAQPSGIHVSLDEMTWLSQLTDIPE